MIGNLFRLNTKYEEPKNVIISKRVGLRPGRFPEAPGGSPLYCSDDRVLGLWLADLNLDKVARVT